jgi:uncharacterized protein (TIGR02996 family)
MSDDQGFRSALLADPEDTTTRLVYADWLDERDDPRGEFLRLEVELSTLPTEDARRPVIEERLRQLQAALDPAWLAALDRTLIENCRGRIPRPCGPRSRVRCPGRWERLTPTRDERVRHCRACGEHVIHCATIQDAWRFSQAGARVAVDSRLTRTEGDLSGPAPSGLLLGDFHVGQRVHVLSGMFAEMEGEIERVNTPYQTATVALTIFGRVVLIELLFSELAAQ